MTQQTSLNLEHCEAEFPSAIYVAEVENLRAYCAKYRLQMSFSHPPGVAFPIESRGAGAIAGYCVLQWSPLPEGAKCPENEKRITESGAVSIALLMIHLLTDFELAAVPEEGTGFDFVLRRKGANGVEKSAAQVIFTNLPEMDASDRIGLEVSGTNNRGSANSRNSLKIKQVQNAKIKTDYIKHVIIIDFQTPRAITGVVEFQR